MLTSIYGLFLLAFAASLFNAHGESCQATLTKVDLPASPKCVDGSTPAFYIADQSGSSSEYIIWLGDSDLCANEADCNAKCGQADECSGLDLDIGDFNPSTDIELTIDCYYAKLSCGTANYPTTVKGQTLMCGDVGAPFASYTRVFIPQCSRDWFLGNGNIIDPNSTLFHGSTILNDVLDNIPNLATATRVVWGGTRGGGIGALNQLALIKSKAVSAEVLGVMDSAWFIRIAEFGIVDFSDSDLVFSFNTRLKTQTANWLQNSSIDAVCRSRWSGVDRVNCLYAPELVVNSIDQAQKLFFSQSQYDLVLLSQNGLADSSKESEFSDEVSFASNAIRFVEQYGSSMRLSYENANAAEPPHFFFSPSCAQYGPLVMTDIEVLSDTNLVVGSAGEFLFRRTNDLWEQLNISGITLKDALDTWISSDGNVIPSLPSDPVGFFESNVRADRCGSFLCNDACPSTVIPFKLTDSLDDSIRPLVLFVAAGFLAVGVVGLGILCLQVRAFRFSISGYWHKRINQLDNSNFVLAEELQKLNLQRKVVALSVQNLNYWITQKKTDDSARSFGCLSRAKYAEVQILTNVSIGMRPGEIHAIMGPSGSGKSTLLDILSNTRNIGRMEGVHAINGVPSHLPRAEFLREWLRHNLGYVRQSDVLFPKLTVKEHLVHAAWLMLPQSMKTREKLDRVWLVTRLFDLVDKRDVPCGEGGISNGERKRLAVATQLLKFPATLVLDEPTSGLDSSNALILVNALQDIAQAAQINVIMTIHQPRREIFEKLNQLTILVAGRIAFSGSPSECAQFFGLNVNEVNIGDDILDKLKSYEIDKTKLGRLFEKYQSSQYAQTVDQYLKEEQTNLSKETAGNVSSLLKKEARKEGRRSWNKATSTRSSMKVLMSRTLKRGGFDVIRSGLISFVAGAIIGAIFIEAQTYTGKTALAYLTISATTFISFTFLGNRYKSEKIMWEHERDAGTEISWVALLTSQFLRNIVSGCIESFAFGSAAYWIGGLNPDFDKYLITILLVVLTGVAVIAQNTLVDIYLIRKGAKMEDRLSIIINMTLLCFGVLFNGFIIPLGELPVYYQWASYILITFWSFVGVLINNFRDFDFPCDLSKLECATRTGNNQVIRRYEYQNFDVYVNIIVLLAFILFFKVASVIVFYYKYVRRRGGLARSATREDDKALAETEVIGRTMTILLSNRVIETVDSGPSMVNPTYEAYNQETSSSNVILNNKNPFMPRARQNVQIADDDV